MAITLFLQSEIQNPYRLYEDMLRYHPVYWDSTNSFWAVYSYANCKAVLSSPFAQIPGINQDNKNELNEYALLITGKIARLSNATQHETAKQIAMLLFDKMKAISIDDIIQKLLQKENNTDRIDWVNSICKKLPVAAVLKSFEFNEDDGAYISGNIEFFLKIMLPDKTPEQVTRINEISKEIYTITRKHLMAANLFTSIINTVSKKYDISRDETVSLFVSNLIGLFIQSFDAGRGVLSNSLLQILTRKGLQPACFNDEKYLQKCVLETLRFDPPVHNTRRFAVDDITLNNVTIKKNETIFIVLAAANRDPEKFIDPHVYNIGRVNNTEHLTFGVGSHICPAKHFSVNLATNALLYVFARYNTIQLVEKTILYEPTINTRLPKNIFISLS